MTEAEKAELYAHPGWKWCTAEGAREDVLRRGMTRSFREKLEWLEEAETLVLQIRAARERSDEASPRQTPEDFASLYRRAFAEFGATALWSSRAVPDPTPKDALAITYSLRLEGDLRARRLAELIEEACRAAQ